MKNTYLLAFLILSSGYSFAQKKMTDIAAQKKNIVVSNTVTSIKHENAKGITIWQNDFSNSNDWAFDNTSSPYLDWTITTAADTIPVPALSPALFTSVGNGFAFINSDAQGQNGAQNANMTYTGTINCTGYANVSLVFEQQYRTYLDTRIMRISNDGGLTWTDFIVTDGTEPTAQNSNNPDVFSINISSVAGNQANVKVQINYQGNWGWYWAVDDIKIVETDNYDLKLQTTAWGTDGAFGARLPYYQVPIAQIAPVNFGGVVKNIGVQDISDATFGAVINGVYTGTSAPTFIAASSIDTLWCTTTFTPAAASAIHAVQLGVMTSQTEPDMTNNTLPNINIDVNNNIYARDKGTILGGIGNAGQGYEVGNMFDIFTNATLKGIDAYIHPTAAVGGEMFVKLYYNNVATGVFDFVDESLPYIITTADLGQKITLTLQTPQPLLANESYLAMVGSYGDGGVSNDLITGTSGSSAPSTAFYYDYTDQTWYYTSSSPMVRMNFDPSLGLNENTSESEFSIYPNPSNNFVNIQFKNETDGMIYIKNIAGQVVKTVKVNDLNTNISTQDLSAGTYLITWMSKGKTSTSKLLIQH